MKTVAERSELFTKDIPALYYADNKNKGASSYKKNKD